MEDTLLRGPRPPALRLKAMSDGQRSVLMPCDEPVRALGLIEQSSPKRYRTWPEHVSTETEKARVMRGATDGRNGQKMTCSGPRKRNGLKERRALLR